jgi:hypothetical protein
MIKLKNKRSNSRLHFESKMSWLKCKRSQEEGLGLGGSHTIEMIIAVLGLTLLLLFVVPLLISFFNAPSREKQQADATVDLIKADIETMSDGESRIFLINSPENWYLNSFPKEFVPPTCSLGQYCLCICEEKPADLNACSIKKKSGCTSISTYGVIVNPMQIKQYMQINITRIKNEIRILKI